MFRVRAANVYGWGDFSSTVTVKAAGKPGTVLSVSTTIDETTGYLKISWLPPSSNGDPIDEYKIEISNVLMTSIITEDRYCDGTSTTVLQNLYCLVPMDALTSTDAPYDYGYTVNSLVKVYVSAHNDYGYGSASTVNTAGAKVRTVPIAPATPTVGTPATDTEVQIMWTALTYGVDTGLVAITSYSLYSDNAAGDGIFNEIATGLITSYTVTGLTGGATYLFKVRATNMYGSGSFSSTLSYVPQDVPSEVGIPDVSITSPTSSSTTVTIDWDKPDEHSSSITEYDVRFLTSTGTYVRSTSECAGTDSTTLDSTSCTVSMSEIISITGLSRDSVIRVKVRAINAIGSGAYSELNTEGATIETVPTGSTTVSFDLSLTTNTATTV